MKEIIRRATVAGSFYEGRREKLRKQVEECYTHPLGPGELPQKSLRRKGEILGIVSPHAGYLYSGPVAAWGFREVIEKETPEIVVILGPNHYGIGGRVSLMSEGFWETPLGRVEIDKEIAEKIGKVCPFVEFDERAHLREHSLEVQLPFLQYSLGNEFKIIPICMQKQSEEISRGLGKGLAEVLKEKDVLIIASTDFTHYERREIAEKNDRKVIKAILSLQPEKVIETVLNYNVSMCGPGPVMGMIVATSLLGAKKARLLKYATSGDITGDYASVVGYASISVER